MVQIKTREEVDLIRESCRIVAQVLRMLEKSIRPGVSTKELDEIAEDFIRSQGAKPAFKGYNPPNTKAYPASICASTTIVGIGRTPPRRRFTTASYCVQAGAAPPTLNRKAPAVCHFSGFNHAA